MSSKTGVTLPGVIGSNQQLRRSDLIRSEK